VVASIVLDVEKNLVNGGKKGGFDLNYLRHEEECNMAELQNPPTMHQLIFLISLGDFKYKGIFGGEMKMSCINRDTCGAQKLNCCSNLHGCKPAAALSV
jgi:hypothetical protein